MQWRTQEFCSWGVKQIQLRAEDRENGDLGTVVRGSGDSCNLVQEISFLYGNIFLIFGTVRLFMMTTNLRICRC